jgi:hypothetical protein
MICTKLILIGKTGLAPVDRGVAIMKSHLKLLSAAACTGTICALLFTSPAQAQTAQGSSNNQSMNQRPTFRPSQAAIRRHRALELQRFLAYSYLLGSMSPGYMGYGPAAMGTPYMPPYAPYGAYSSMSTGYSNGGYGGGSNGNNAMQQSPQLTTMPRDALDTLRSGSGPGMGWPLGLRRLEPKEKSKELRDRIDDAVGTMFLEQAGPEGNPSLLEQVTQQLDQIERLYKANVWDMALTSQQEKDVKRFLQRFKDALTAAEDSSRRYESQMRSPQAGYPSQNSGYGQPQNQGGGTTPSPYGGEPTVPGAPGQPVAPIPGVPGLPPLPNPVQPNSPQQQPGNPQPQPTKPQPKPKPTPPKPGTMPPKPPERSGKK